MFELDNAIYCEAREVIKQFKIQRKGLKKLQRTELSTLLINNAWEGLKPLGVSRLQLLHAIGVINNIYQSE